jgi:hypothetical protein
MGAEVLRFGAGAAKNGWLWRPDTGLWGDRRLWAADTELRLLEEH